MNRKLLHDLIRLREVRLREQTAKLKQASRGLTDIRTQHEQARDSAARSIETADTLAYLEVFGHSRIKYAKLAIKAEEQVRGMVERVGHARKLADSAREAGAEMQRALASERERSMETEAEHFFSWSKVFGR
jgi:hypothetical protein